MLGGERLRGSVARVFRDPFVTSRVEWDTDTPVELVEDQLAERYAARPTHGDEIRWRGTTEATGLAQFRTVRLTQDGTVRVTVELPGVVRAFVLGLVLLAPVLIPAYAVGVVIGYFAIIVVINQMGSTDRPVPACAVMTAQHEHDLLQVLMLVALAGVGWFIIDVVPAPFRQYFVVGLVVLALPILYLNNDLPFLANKPGRRVLLLPYQMITTAVGSFVMFFPFLGLGGFVYYFSEYLADWVTPFNQAKASILSDLTGGELGRIGSDGTFEAPDPEAIRTVIFGLLEVFFPVVLAVVVIQFLLWLRESKQFRDRLQRMELPTFTAGRQRLLAFTGYVLLTGVLLSMTAVAVSVIAFGMTGTVYPPARGLTPLIEVLPSQFDVTVRGFLAGTYQALDYLMRNVPLVTPRAGSLLVMGVFFWPFVFLTVGTGYELLARPYRTLTTLRRSVPLSDPAGQDLLPPDVQVRRIPLDDQPDARPLVVLFGFRKYVIVSDIVVETLTREQLEGILRHEEYHLRERDVRLVAEVLSLLFGGKNALLAFYDYRQSEQAADRYAVEQTTLNAVREGLDRLYNLQSQRRITSKGITVRHPSIIEQPTRDVVSESAQTARDLLTRIKRTVLDHLRAPYELYFGSILLETAHHIHRERKARLDEFRNRSD